ncbi:MAG TPA: AarF/UbiB family protein, partial [Acidobacteriota bacterium]|nr:AarF/UbiB family protein [Acidobacteriota bacterium]
VETILLDTSTLSILMEWIRPIFGSHYLYRGFEVLLSEFKRIVVAELDFRIEATNADRIRAQEPRHPRLIIPEMIPELVYEDLLVMEFCEGVRIDQIETIRTYGVDLNELIETLLEIIFSQLLVHGFFHADPHPGNLLINRQGQIILLDYGMMDELDPVTRDDFLGLILAANNNDYEEVTRKLYLLGMVATDAPTDDLRMVTETILNLRFLVRTHQRQVQQAVEELFEKTRILHHLRMPRQMVYLMRMGTLIEGVAIRFDDNFDSIRDAVPIAKRVGLRIIARIVPFATALRYTAEVVAEQVDAFLGRLTQRKKVTVVRNFVSDVTRRLRPAPNTPALPIQSE